MCVGSSLRTQLGFICTQLCFCVCMSVLVVLHRWERACVCGVLSTYVHFYFNCFTSICNPNTSFCHFCIWTSLHPSFYLYSCIENIIFHHFHLNQESNVIFFFCCPHSLMLAGEVPIRWWSSTTFLSPKLEPIFEKWASSLSLAFFWKGPRVLPWCNALLRGGGILLTPFILLELEMMVTPYDFYCMNDLSFEGAIFILDGMSRF